MSSPPTPPEGYQLAERGGLYPGGALNRIYLPAEGLWTYWGQIDASCWRPWFDGTPVYYAVRIPNQTPRIASVTA